MRPFENGGENYDIFIRKLDNDGNYLTNDIRVNSDTSNYQWFINMFIDDATDVIIVVYGTRVDSNPNLKHYYFRQFDFDLNPISDDTPLYVSDDETINEFRAGFLPPSKIIAIWQQEYNIIGDRELLLRHMSFDGSESSEPISMHNQEFGNYFSPNITPISSGGALLLWGAVDDYSIGAIWARRIDGNGEFIDQNDRPISYPTYISSLLHQTPYASYNPEGDLLAVCWVQDGDGSGPETYRVFERIFNSELVALSDTSKISLFDSYEFYSTWDPINYFIGSDSVFTVWSAYINSYDDDDILATTTQINPTDIANEGPELPRLIFTAYPNPFNVQTKLSYELPKASNVTITVYNIQGQVVNILRNEKQPAGFHEVIWDASDLSSGIYFYRLQAGDVTETRKISLLK
ncbi:MAG: T9SS type A sorting domain-containing protein [candidate division Zixibacteria bacterium]|nr:T9SS type A sorting domain-containing protein [candidate division Zixibacteria bacterium]